MPNDSFELKDSGERRKAETGAHRDRSIGKGRFDLLSPIADERAARWLERGALKYDARNWEQGMPFSWFLDSLRRHINKYLEGHRDEDHLAAARFNIDGLIHTEEMVRRGGLPSSLNDLPNYLSFKPQAANEPLRVYVAGPFNAPSLDGRRRNLQVAVAAGLQIMKRGHLAHVPHAATNFWDPDLGYEDFMRLDLSLIREWATALLYLGSSPGADRELDCAEKLGLPIFTSVDDLPSIE